MALYSDYYQSYWGVSLPGKDYKSQPNYHTVTACTGQRWGRITVSQLVGKFSI